MTEPVVKRIVCLANSRKLSGRCIAGKDLESGSWIRPVSDRPKEEVSEYERSYEDGSDPGLLDIIDVPLIRPRPRSYQAENWLLNPDYYWVRADRATWDDLAELTDDPPTLWINESSTYHGLNDRVPEPEAEGLPNSLYFLSLEELTVHVFAPGRAFGNNKRRVHGAFQHGDDNYRLWITDPTVERLYLAESDGEYRLGPCYVTISLGEPHDGFCYKLIAGVVAPSLLRGLRR